VGKLWANFNQVGETAHRAGPQAIDFIGFIGGPDRDRTDDLFHAMEARSQLRHRPTMLQGCNSPIVSAGVRFVKPKAEQEMPFRSIPGGKRVLSRVP
jgi:hypothetical protein